MNSEERLMKQYKEMVKNSVNVCKTFVHVLPLKSIFVAAVLERS